MKPQNPRPRRLAAKLRFSSLSPQDAGPQRRVGNRSPLRGAYVAGLRHGKLGTATLTSQSSTDWKRLVKQSGGFGNFNAPHVARELTPGASKNRRKMAETAYKAGYAKGKQRRVPAGSPRGGQFAGKGG